MLYLTDEDYAIAASNGISKKNAYQRFYDYGMSKEEAITKQIRQYVGVWIKWKDICIKHGVTNPLFNYRLRKGMTPKEAATKPVRGKTS